MQALVFTRNELRYAVSKAVSQVSSSRAVNLSPLKLKEIEPFPLPDVEGWQKIFPRLSGICGSDLSTLSGKTSRYFESLVSFPFVMGHEIVASNESGERVVVDAVLGAEARGCPAPYGAAPNSDYGHLVSGKLPPGMQTGNCKDVGGGWGTELAAHSSQLFPVPKDFSDEAAVMVEPTASGIHAALKAKVEPGATAVVVGAGTIGQTTIAGLRKYTPVGKILAAAKHPSQQKMAVELGADAAVPPGELTRLLRKMLNSKMTGDYLGSGADVAIDAVGSSASLKSAMKLVRPGGRLVACGMPGTMMLDLAPLWHREVELVGSYAYGMENNLSKDSGEPVHTFEMAMELVDEAGLENLVSESYPLKDYKEALTHAFEAGKRGDFKIVFDLKDG